MKRKLLLAMLCFAAASVYQAHGQTDVPFLFEKTSFEGTAVSSLSTFVPGTDKTYTLELTGCVANQEITVPGGSFSYTPETGGTVRFVRNGGDVVYVYEGKTYKGTVEVSTPAAPTFPDIYDAIDNSGSGTGIYSSSNLFKNPGFETKGDKLSDHNFKGMYWDCNGYSYGNVSRVRDNTTLNNQEGTCTFLLHGYGSPADCLSQTITSLQSFTPYQVKFSSWRHDNNTCTYKVTVGKSAGDETLYSGEITTPNNNNRKDQSFTFTTKILSESSYVFAITRKTANRIGNFDRMTMVAANGGGIGITGATGASFLSGSAFAPEGAVENASTATLESPKPTSYVTNGMFDSNTTGWITSTGTTCNSKNGYPNNQQGAFTEKFCENWATSNFTGKTYQSVSNIPNGTYKLNICAFAFSVDADKGQYVYAGSNKSYIYTPVPTAYAVYVYVDNHTLEYGIQQENDGNRWIGIDNVSLEYCGSNNVAEAGFKAIYDAATNHLNDIDYSNVTGEEKTNLQSNVDATPTADVDGYATATFNIGYSDYIFMSAKPEYDRYVAEKANADRINNSITSGISAPTTANGCDAVINNILVAEYNYVSNTNNFNAKQAEAYDLAIGNWTFSGTYNNSTADTRGSNSNEHWSGETITYYEQGAHGWANSNWVANYNKTVTLPAGMYVLRIAARASDNTTSSMKVTIGETVYSEVLPCKGGAGKGVTTDGVASFSDGTFANTNGRGWQWRYLAFTLTDESSVRFDIDASASSKNQWASFGDVELYSNVNLSDLETALTNFTMETIGFEKDEYAPYKNVEVLDAYEKATEILNGNIVPSTQAAVNNITGVLNSPTWTQNTEEVNAIAGGADWSSYTTHSGQYDIPDGWTNTGYNTRIVGITESLPANNPGLDGVTNSRALLVKFGTTYGGTTGYTLPLKANTVYKFTFKYGLWDENITINKDLSVTSPSNVTINMIPSRVSKNEGDKNKCANKLTAAWYEYETWFKTAEAGDYILHIDNTEVGNQRQMVFAELELKKAVAEDLTLDEEATNSPSYTYANVTLNRTIKAGKNTLVLPFDLTQEQVETAFGTGATIYNVDDAQSTETLIYFVKGSGIKANVPVLLETSVAGTTYEFANVLVNAKNNPTQDGTNVKFVGTYIKSEVPENNNNYIISGDKLYLVDSSMPIKGMRAYFNMPQATDAKIIGFQIGDGEATSIVNINNDANSLNGTIYDLSGRAVKNPVRGIYIVNGKKVMIK